MIAEWRWFSVKTLPIAELQEEHFTFFPWSELQSSHIIQKVTMQRVSAAISSVFKVHCFTVLCSPYWSLIKHTYIKFFFTDFFTLFFFTDVQTALLTGFLPKLSKDKCHYTSCALQRFDMKFWFFSNASLSCNIYRRPSQMVYSIPETSCYESTGIKTKWFMSFKNCFCNR